MRHLRRFLRRSSADRRAFVTALMLLAALRMGSWLVSLDRLRLLLARLLPGGEVGEPDPGAVDRVVWAVTRASFFVPDALCLQQALAAQAMLARHGQSSRLRIGVAHYEGIGRQTGHQRLHAHAWLEQGGEVILGGAESPSDYEIVPLSLVR